MTAKELMEILRVAPPDAEVRYDHGPSWDNSILVTSADIENGMCADLVTPYVEVVLRSD